MGVRCEPFAARSDWERSSDIGGTVATILPDVLRHHGSRYLLFRAESMVAVSRQLKSVFLGGTPRCHLSTRFNRTWFAAGMAITGGSDADVTYASTIPVWAPAVSALEISCYPALEFRGAVDSANWNHDFPLDGRKVAVIGTGASAIQFVPEIAPSADSLAIFQRSAPWVVPKVDREISPTIAQKWRRWPWRQKLLRWFLFGAERSFGSAADRMAGSSGFERGGERPYGKGDSDRRFAPL